jgi:hypothetical protein
VRKRILWVEDKIETIFDMIVEDRLFNQNLDEIDLLEFDNLKDRDIERMNEFLRTKDIFISQDFCEACEIIFNEENFDIIILDVNFPSPKGDDINSTDILKAKELFVNSCYSQKIKKEFETVFNEIIGLDQYSGIMLFFIICLYYEKERNISEVTKKICIFTQYDVNFDDFLTKIYEKISEHSLSELEITKYIKDIERRYWSKTKEQDISKLKNFIEYDKYLEILEKRTSTKTADLFLRIQSKKNSENKLDIIYNLGALRLIFHKILKTLAKSLKVKTYIDSRDGKNVPIYYGNSLNVRPFITYLVFHSKKLEVNKFIRNILYSIQDICSDFGLAHNELEDDYKEEELEFSEIKPTGFQPTSNTVNALICNLKDIIVWLDGILE